MFREFEWMCCFILINIFYLSEICNISFDFTINWDFFFFLSYTKQTKKKKGFWYVKFDEFTATHIYYYRILKAKYWIHNVLFIRTHLHPFFSFCFFAFKPALVLGPPPHPPLLQYIYIYNLNFCWRSFHRFITPSIPSPSIPPFYISHLIHKFLIISKETIFNTNLLPRNYHFNNI